MFNEYLNDSKKDYEYPEVIPPTATLADSPHKTSAVYDLKKDNQQYKLKKMITEGVNQKKL
ncbi:MAG: hypothetical protein BZ137_02670 [Methanosphaera sp. rholeuAM130]|nr:MAG: hypothetical protein BZ137_02670 [Methanosphaera sp. rholeuAM130]